VRYRLASDVRFRVVGGEGVVVLQDAGEVLVVNGVAARVLELLDLRREPLPGREGRSAEELIARLVEEFDASNEDIERDVRDFLEEIREAGVVQEVAAGSGDDR